MEKKTRIRIPNLNKVRAELQKEIGSLCPFCNNDDVGHFEIHHIDNDPGNNDISNLILLCPTCHSKITKSDITMEEVIDVKSNRQNKNSAIQFLSVTIDSENCGWVPIENVKNAFRLRYFKSIFPIFNFTFINHTDKTVVLTNIRIATRRLPIGLSGPHIPMPQVLRSVIKYKLEMPRDGEIKDFTIEDQIEVPQGRAVKFQLELYTESVESFNPQFCKYVLNFDFGFNNYIYVSIPKVLLNTEKDYDKLVHFGLS